MGAAMRFMISDPVPVDHRIGTKPMLIVAKVMNLGRNLVAAPSAIASYNRRRVSGFISPRAFSYAKSRYRSMKTPVSASIPSNAIIPNQTAILRLYPNAYTIQSAPTAENGTASRTIAVLASERVFEYSRRTMIANVTGTTSIRRCLTRAADSYCPLHKIEYPGGRD